MLDSFDKVALSAIATLLVCIGIVIALGDRVGAAVDSVVPVDGSQAAATTGITIAFSQSMQIETVEERFSIEPEVDGTFDWVGSAMTFRPDEPLAYGETYTVGLAAGVRSTADRSGKARSWSFTVREPSVLYLAPADVFVQSLWLAPTDGSAEPVSIFAPEFGVFDFAPSPDGSKIAVTVYDDNQTTDIWLLEPDGSNPTKLTDCEPGLCSAPAWSPDGQLMAYERRDEGVSGAGIVPSRVWVYDFVTSETAPVFANNQVLGYGPVFAPDGQRLAFVDSNLSATNPNPPTNAAIRIVDLESGRSNTVIPTDMGAVGTFSPDGSSMVFADIRQVGRQFFTQLLVADFEGEGGIGNLIDGAEEDQWPAWSPDGTTLAFSRRLLDRSTGFGSQLSLYNVQDDSLTTVTNDPEYNSLEYYWSPTGERLVFTRIALEGTFPQPEVWMYDRNADELIRISENARNPNWLP